MKNTNLLLLFFLLVGFYTQAQQLQSEQERIIYNNTLGNMSKVDSAYLCGLPQLPIPEIYTGPNAPLLPYSLDNSTQACFRPAYNQAGYSCGQAALVGYNYTYEANRIRELPGNVPENQYPTHFTWNFWNAGNLYGGVSYFTSMEIMKGAGNPTVAEYGGMAYGGEKRWMSGYDSYFNAMANRITTAYSLNVRTAEGIQNLKNYLNDHLDGSNIGGLASFYANQPALNNLPSGTPEAGKKVVIAWNWSTHALTIVGWNDSIRWDYNNDGQYTNDIDINNDGIINVKDWEIGGFKFVNSYGGVPNWGDDGFSYMMYKTVADEYGQGGIWNNTVNTLNVKENYSPQLTMKVVLKHSRRKAVKVMAGFASDTTATEPEQIFDFPIFNYQGGDNNMQGGSTEEDKTIEFGLDISHLLSYFETGDYAKFFVIVNEHDPEQWGSGFLISYSLMDYTNGLTETQCPESNIFIPHNGTVSMSVVHQLNHSEVNIDNNSLPPAPQGQPFNCQLEASGGTAPYYWSINHDYIETANSGPFPNVNANRLYPSNNNNGTVEQAIDFSFPFYGKDYETITVHADGFLKFNDDTYIWPYLLSDELLFKRTALIAPFNADLNLYSWKGDGIWYEGDASGAIFYWKTSLNGQAEESNLNFSVKLFPSGDIKFYYGENEIPAETKWFAGSSKGNSLDYQFLEVSGIETLPENYIVDFATNFYPNEMTLSEDGFFSGTPLQNYTGINIKFKATDNNNVFTYKTLQFSSSGILIDPSISSGDDDIIEYAENAFLSTNITNSSGVDMINASVNIYINDSNFILLDSTEFIGTLENGHSINLVDAFNFNVSPNVPNYCDFSIQTEIICDDTTYLNNLFFTAYAPVIMSNNIIVNDNDNNILDPGETTDIIVEIKNTGGSNAHDLNIILSSDSEFVTINNPTEFISELTSDSIVPLTFNITVNEDTQLGYLLEFDLDFTSPNGFINYDTFNLPIGNTNENFETGNFNRFSWGNIGEKNWQITQDYVYEGIYSSRSGNIIHNQESSLIIDIEVLNESNLSFYRKVSCEDDSSNNNNYDYLAFYIDGFEHARWDGILDWEKETFNVTAGFHSFEWRFHKDHSVSLYSDCAWIDAISFPSGIVIDHYLEFNPMPIYKEMRPDSIKTDTLTISNFSPYGDVNYQIRMDNAVEETANRSISGSLLECSEKYVNTGQEFSWEFTAYNGSNDSEWVMDIFMDFPDGIIIDSMTNFVGGSEELEHDSSIGNGAIIHWHGENDEGWGALKGMETALAIVYGHAETTLIQDFSVAAEMQGDIYGADPHVLFFDVDFINLGEINTWLTLDTLQGTVDAGESDIILLNYNTTGLPEGEYNCELLINDNFNNETIIPVNLVVELHVGKDDLANNANLISVYPNPFTEKIHVEANIEKGQTAIIELFNTNGIKLVSKKMESTKDGIQNFEINANFSKGVYFLSITIGNQKQIKKIVKL